MVKRILVVEDEKPLAKALQLKLTFEGFEVESVFNGEDALTILKSESFDLILLDIIMPLNDGFHVLEKLKLNNSKIPIIVSSNLSQAEDIDRAKSLGAVDYFVKSDTALPDIIEIINKYL